MDFVVSKSANGIANSAGRATARLQPEKANESWVIANTSVQSTSTTLVPTVKLYRGAESPSRFIEGTYSGQLDNSNTRIVLHPGEILLAIWEGADVGSNCTITVDGEGSR